MPVPAKAPLVSATLCPRSTASRLRAQRRKPCCSKHLRRVPLAPARAGSGDDAGDLAPSPSSLSSPVLPPAASFSSTPSVVRGLVSALTAAVNFVAGGRPEESSPPDGAAAEQLPPLAPAELLAGVRADFTENGYLWTGDISAELYDRDCSFTDPTLSFTGLATFQRNLAALQPVLRRALRTREIDLLEVSLHESRDSSADEGGFVEARWRMGGDLALPWQPRIELTGRTRFYFSSAAAGRIVRYVETWDIPAAAALAQILVPFAWKGGSSGAGT